MSFERAVLVAETLGELSIEDLEGVERMNAQPSFSVRVLTDDAEISLEELVGASVVVVLADEQGEARRIPLLVAAARYEGERRGEGRTRHRYGLDLSSPLTLLRHRRGYRVFLDQTVKEIVTAVLDGAGLGGDAVQWRLTEALHARPQCVQYDESEGFFLERLLADEGIAFWHESDGQQSVVVFGDAPASHDDVEETFRFDDGSGLRHSAAAFTRLERTFREVPTAAAVRDFDMRQPDVLVEGRTGDGYLEHYEYPAWVPHADAAQTRARVRLEQRQRDEVVVVGQTLSARVVAGRVVTLEDMPEADLDGAYLAVGVHHRVEQRRDDGTQPYRAEVTMVPHGARTYRPEVPTEVPRLDGIDRAVVTGPSGEEIHVDDLGRIKVLTPWDASGRTDDRTSAWARTTQWNMDGSMLLPRMGFPMAVAYRDGRPDMPVVLGKLYDGGHRSPYDLPAQRATASLLSDASPGGGNVNEIKLTDDAGTQSFGVQASGDQGVAVGGDANITVAVDEAHNVQGNLTEHIQGAATFSVGANQTITAGTAHATKTGARTVNVGGSENVGADLNHVVDCGGAYVESVGGLYFMQCNTAAETCKASFAQVVGGAVVVAAGIGLSEAVLGARTETCGGPRLVAAGAFEDKVHGVKTITCGANTLTAGAAIVTDVKGGATVTAGATSLKAGGTIEIVSGGSITIAAAALKVSGGTNYSIAGAHMASADVNLDNSTAKMRLTKAKK
ncbi:MAG: type VI secretion system tip protein TssI/VgrG [Myxococcota bacterium]